MLLCYLTSDLFLSSVSYYIKFWQHLNLANFLKIAKLKCTKIVAKFKLPLNLSEYNIKCRHLVSFTQSCCLTVDNDVYRMSCAHFSHFSLTTEMDSTLVLNFAFPCGLHLFHIYKELWNPILNENLDTIREKNNPLVGLD